MKKTAIMTGATGGIGSVIANELLKRGYRVIALSRRIPDSRFEHIPCDLSNPKEIDKVARGLFSRINNIDLIILSAGVGHFGCVENLSAKHIEQTMSVNFTSQAILVSRLIPLMKKQNSGKVVAIGSEAALNGAKMGSVYCASKFALRGFCQALRLECKQSNIAVSMLHPGLMNTDFYDNCHFQPDTNPSHCIDSLSVLRLFSAILDTPSIAVIEECVIQPMQPRVVKKNK